MTPKTKKIVIVGGSLLVIGGIVGYVLWKHKKENEKPSVPNLDAPPVDSGLKSLEEAGGVSDGISKVGSSKGSTSKPKEDSTKTVASPIDYVVANFGVSSKKVKDGVLVPFNSKKNYAVFYTNGRVVIFDTASKKRIKAGSYLDGGKTIKLDSGKVISSGSAWANLLNALK